MESRSFSGISLYYDAEEQTAADLIGEACKESIAIIEAHWRLEPPPNTRVYVLTSWPRFVLHSAPIYWWPLLAITLPWWVPRASARWKIARGWEQNYWTRQAVGVKPPRLVEPLIRARRTSEKYFVVEEDPKDLIRNTTGHELTHACAAHLQLPMWLNEGLAMRTVDKLFDMPMVKPDSLAALDGPSRDHKRAGYASVNAKDQEALLCHYVRAYWTTRYVEETRPDLLRNLLARRHGHQAIDEELATAYGVRRGEFWREIDRTLVAHFERA